MKISILGCGWLGEPLAEHFVRAGHAVKGSTTSPEKLARLQEKGIDPYLIRFEPGADLSEAIDFFDCDALFLNIPPGRRDPDVKDRFADRMRLVLDFIRRGGTEHVIFASSTSVYPDLNRVVYEEDARGADSASGRALLEAERALRSDPHFTATVVRFAGLYGYDRRPGRFMAGKVDVPGGNAPVNLIHRDDCIRIVSMLVEQGIWGETLSACSDEHPTRRAFYTWAARRQGFSPPTFLEDAAVPFKIVSNDHLKQRLGYTFLYPDPMQDAP